MIRPLHSWFHVLTDAERRFYWTGAQPEEAPPIRPFDVIKRGLSHLPSGGCDAEWVEEVVYLEGDATTPYSVVLFDDDDRVGIYWRVINEQAGEWWTGGDVLPDLPPSKLAEILRAYDPENDHEYQAAKAAYRRDA